MARGRKPGFRMSEEHRTKIGNSQILKRLIECAEGKSELSSTQAQVGLGLMRKVLPDLSSVQHAGDQENPLIHEIRRIIVDPKKAGNTDS